MWAVQPVLTGIDMLGTELIRSVDIEMTDRNGVASASPAKICCVTNIGAAACVGGFETQVKINSVNKVKRANHHVGTPFLMAAGSLTATRARHMSQIHALK